MNAHIVENVVRPQKVLVANMVNICVGDVENGIHICSLI